MAYLSNDDLQEITDWIELQTGDADFLTPTGISMFQCVGNNAPRMLDYINSVLALKYAVQSSPLEDTTKTILMWLTWAEVQYFAYRQSVITEKTWADEWFERANDWLLNISKGYMTLTTPQVRIGSTPSFSSEPRQFTISNDTSTFTNENIKDLDTIL